MKKLSIILVTILVSVLTLVPSSPALADPFIEVVPLDYDFGDVEVGSSSTAMITISNMDGHDLEIYSVSLSGSADFSITMAPDTIISPGMSTEVEVTFAPSAVGYYSTLLEIESNDSGNPLVSVSLGGEGVTAEPPPPTSIAEILDFFDSSVADGSLVGSGSGKSAENRLNALRNLIEAAGKLIAAGDNTQACQQLLDTYKKCNGELNPPDFVSGPAVATLAGMIQDLRASLGC